jgi:hypothetical protein
MKYLIALLFCFIWNVYSAQVGKQFPSIKGITLDDKGINIPNSNKKYSVVAIAFNRQAEDDLKTWLNPLFQTFIKDEKESTTGMDMAEVYDVNFVFVPMIAGFKLLSEKFKKDTDKRFWQYVMDTEKTDIKALQEQLGITDNKIPYFFVLDPSGKVLAFQSGKFIPAKIDKLEDAVE